MNNLACASRSNLRQGAVYMLIGLIWGMMVPATPFPRLALTAHIQLTANGIMFLVAGLVILRLPIAKSSMSAKILVAGPWLTSPARASSPKCALVSMSHSPCGYIGRPWFDLPRGSGCLLLLTFGINYLASALLLSSRLSFRKTSRELGAKPMRGKSGRPKQPS